MFHRTVYRSRGTGRESRESCNRWTLTCIPGCGRSTRTSWTSALLQTPPALTRKPPALKRTPCPPSLQPFEPGAWNAHSAAGGERVTWRTAALGDFQGPGAGRRYRNRLARGGLVGVTATGSYAVGAHLRTHIYNNYTGYFLRTSQIMVRTYVCGSCGQLPTAFAVRTAYFRTYVRAFCDAVRTYERRNSY